MAFGVAFYVAVAASVAASYVESEAQKTKARTIRGIRQREAEDITKKNIESGEQTQATADRFKGADRTALTELQDRRNIESLKEVEEDVREGTDPSDTGFAGTSQTFAGKREERQAEDAKRAEADRLASARFLSPGQSALAEQQFIQDLGIENQTLALDARGRQQVANAQVAGVGLKNQGLVTMLKIISYAASAYSIATAGAASASTKAAQKTYEETVKKAITESATQAGLKETTKAALREQFAAAGFGSAYAHPLFEGVKFAEIGASSFPGATNALTNQAAQLANTPVPGFTGQEWANFTPYTGAGDIGSSAFHGRNFPGLLSSNLPSPPANLGQTNVSIRQEFAPRNYGGALEAGPSAHFSGDIPNPMDKAFFGNRAFFPNTSPEALDNEFIRTLLEQEKRLEQERLLQGGVEESFSPASFI